MRADGDLVCRVRQSHADELDTHPDVLVARRAAEAWGVLSLEELRACGLTREAVRVRTRNGRLHLVHRGVYAVGHANLAVEGRFLAAVKACGRRAMLSHLAAAALWGFLAWDDRRIDVTVVGTATRLQPTLRVHRTRLCDPRDVARHTGVPVTAPARTLLDLSSVLDAAHLRRLVRRAQSLHRVNLRQLTELLGRSERRKGTRNLAQIIATGPAPTRSELEDPVLDLILRGALSHPEVNEPLHLNGRRVVPDFRWPDQRLVVEADSRTWHDNPLAREDDADRQALLEAHGERVLRVTWEQAVARPRETLARLRAAGAPPAGRPTLRRA